MSSKPQARRPDFAIPISISTKTPSNTPATPQGTSDESGQECLLPRCTPLWAGNIRWARPRTEGGVGGGSQGATDRSRHGTHRDRRWSRASAAPLGSSSLVATTRYVWLSAGPRGDVANGPHPNPPRPQLFPDYVMKRGERYLQRGFVGAVPAAVGFVVERLEAVRHF
jgi:hypothetical protein